MHDPLLHVSDLEAGYGQMTVLKRVSFNVTKGNIVSIVGPNGAGKTTLMNTLGGLINAQSGSVFYRGVDITTLAPHKRVSEGISLVPERRLLFRNMTVRENLVIGMYQNRDADRKKLLKDIEDVFPRLKERSDQKAGTLSGGEAQMLTIGRSLMTDPELLLLDEPTIGLAPKLIPGLFDAIQHINDKGVSIILVEQRVEDSLDVADYGYLLENGQFAMEGPTTELLDTDEIVERYLGAK